MRKTKIVCTIGPASDSKDVLKEMMLAGMNVARINFSHGSYQEQIERINRIKEVRQELNLPVALLMDTKGPEIRIGKVENNEALLEKGNQFVLVNDDKIVGDSTKVSVTYKELYQEVNIGSRILINDGIIELEVIEIKNKDIVCKIINGGKISNRKSINVPDLNLNLPSMTDIDIEDLKYCIKADFDFIAASFIRKAKDVLEIRQVLEENNGSNIKIISKIENREGINNFDEILEASDGIMVARGDLGVEIPVYEVPLLQKKFIQKCNLVGKPVITATQMLESMVTNARPTRAEVSDIANAVFDMTSAIMLSAESASGMYPVQCVRTMSKIASETENAIDYWAMFRSRTGSVGIRDYEANAARAICLTAMTSEARAIFAYTNTGNSPRKLAGFLPSCPIFAILDNPKTFRQLGLSWNIYPILYNKQGSIHALMSYSIMDLMKKDKLKKGEVIVLSGGEEILKDKSLEELDFNKTLGGILRI